jgi:uncharacterized protein YdeI (YjbR/CyaY-like superfamily)
MAKKKGVQKFKARLVPDVSLAGWTVAKLPFVPSEAWAEMIRLRVCGTVNGTEFRTSLFPDLERPGQYVVFVNKKTQKAAGVELGEEVAFELQADLEERPAELPDELAVLLDEVEGLRDFYDSLSESWRREIGKWIGSVKSEESQRKRCEQMAERLLSTMEAELELPPLIATAMRSRPKAAAGWKKLTPTQRRQELLAIFYYQSPEAREKRLRKSLDLAESKA